MAVTSEQAERLIAVLERIAIALDAPPPITNSGWRPTLTGYRASWWPEKKEGKG